MKPTFSIKEAVLAGWRIFKSRPWLFVGSSLIYLLAQLVLGLVEGMLAMVPLVSFVVSFLLGTLISLGFVAFYLKAHDDVSGTKLGNLWNPKHFWKYLLTTILLSIAVIIGFILLIIPGIIIALALSFSLYLVIEKGLGPIAAFKESARLTRGSRVTLLLLGLLMAVMNVIGAGLLLIGLFVTVPVSMLASIHAYRALSGRTETAPIAEAPAAPAPEAAPAPAA